jgi:hypothetical protein
LVIGVSTTLLLLALAGSGNAQTIDILFYVTPQAITGAGGRAGLISALAGGIGEINSTYNRSGLGFVDVRQVGAIRTDDGVDQHRLQSITTALGLLDSDSHAVNWSRVMFSNAECTSNGTAVPAGTTGGWVAPCCTGAGTGTCRGDQVATDRARLGADLVAVITTQTLGVGCLPPTAANDASPGSHPWCHASSNHWANLPLVLSHEVAHNMGAGHLPIETNGQNGPGIFSFSFAHNIADFGPCILNGFDTCSVVSLVADSGDQTRWERILPNYLSNPSGNVTVPSCCTGGGSTSAPTGSAVHNNAQTVASYAPYVNGYRSKVIFVDAAYTATQFAGTAGTLQAPCSNVNDAIVGQNNSAFDECCTAIPGGTIRIFPDSYPGPLSINANVVLDTIGGPVTLGQ